MNDLEKFNISDDEMLEESKRAISEFYEMRVEHIKRNDNALLANKDNFLWNYDAIKEYLSELDEWEFEGIQQCEVIDKDRDIYKEIGNAEIKYIYNKQDEHEFMIDDVKENKSDYHILIWQNSGGYTGDDFHGFILFPLKMENKYFKISYNC